MYKEDRMKQEAGNAWVEIDRLIMKTRAEQKAAAAELEDLNQRLPGMLLGKAMGSVTKGEVRAIKTRMAELREVLSDTPVVLQELEDERRRRCFRPLQDACMLSRGRREYNGLKSALLECPEERRIEELRKRARELGEEEECEQFLQQISAITWAGKSSSGRN